jgi:hypothetical protein
MRAGAAEVTAAGIGSRHCRGEEAHAGGRGGVGGGSVERSDSDRLGFGVVRQVGPTHQAMAANASSNGSVYPLPRHHWLVWSKRQIRC